MPKKDDKHEELEVEITIVDKDFKRLESGQKLTLGALTLSETPIIISLRRLRSKKKRKNETTEGTESTSEQ
jgi:hypothetical protein